LDFARAILKDECDSKKACNPYNSTDSESVDEGVSPPTSVDRINNGEAKPISTAKDAKTREILVAKY